MKLKKKVNYQKDMERTLERLRKEGRVPRLLLHSCCAPCSSYVLESLTDYFFVTVLYYNPNIFPEEEYKRRVAEQKRLIGEMPAKYPVHFMAKDYNPDEFYEAVKGYEHIPEGGERCFRCYELRLHETALIAKENNFDFYTTTLSISPLKNAEKLNEIGNRYGVEYGVCYLMSDFKKKGGYQRSIELSGEHDLYRQDYCGCIFSRKEREAHKKAGNGME